MCPQCNAPLAPSRFARSVVCSYCGTTVQLGEDTISAKRFHDSFRAWNSPEMYQISSWISIGESHWTTEKLIAQGDISDVYSGMRARWPTELVTLKILRSHKDRSLFDNEWKALQHLQDSKAPGADFFTTIIPQPVTHGTIAAGTHKDKRVNIYRWRSGFHYTFEEVVKAYPHGISPRASIWVWRRILEVLSFLHNSGIAHGAVLPSHLLTEENEHGVMLVGYSSAGQPGEKIPVIPQRFDTFYPKLKQSSLTTQLDLILSARCIIAILGGNPENGSLSATVPERLASTIQRIALSDPSSSGKEDAWAIREELGVIAKEVFGAPQFIPIAMPP